MDSALRDVKRPHPADNQGVGHDIKKRFENKMI